MYLGVYINSGIKLRYIFVYNVTPVSQRGSQRKLIGTYFGRDTLFSSSTFKSLYSITNIYVRK